MTVALQRASWYHPEGGVAILVVFAWLLLLGSALGPSEIRSIHEGAHDAAPLLAGAAGWLLMTVAMMVPSALPVAREHALGALWARRRRTVAIFIGTYVAGWAVLGIGFSLLVAAIDAAGVEVAALLPPVLLGAAAWELTGFKWRAIRRCHLVSPLPPARLKADLACARAATRYCAQCATACWTLMLAMAIAGHGNIGLMILLAGVVGASKLAAKPGRLAMPLAGTLVYAAAVSVVAG
jgi:predicted metal-binding membrane protein